jgi:two-component system, NtrC family, response regulator AtoC
MTHRQATDVLQDPVSAIHTFVHGIGAAMQSLNDTVTEIARTDIPVLVLGESGTGKDAYARLIHRLSLRNEMRFLKINCASFGSGLLPPQILQPRENHSSTHFSGTLYLDNVQELDLTAQRALLSCLPDAEDSDSGLERSPRLISSAISNLESEVELSRFRRELYYRLNGACFRIPPLRERLEDIPALAEHFLNKYAAVLKRNPPCLDDQAIRVLGAHHWPGNIRELENFTRKAVLFGDFQIALNELQAPALTAPRLAVGLPGSSLKLAARAASVKAERELILQALDRTHWNRKRAARELQISYKSLLYKIKQIGVSEEKHED